jgi:hypothetical protein
MSTFDNDPFSATSTYESFENTSHVIMVTPLEIDLNQPNRLKHGEVSAFEEETKYRDSKLIGTIDTPKNHLGIIHTQLADTEPVIMVVRSKSEERWVLYPGDEPRDISDKDEKGKCIVWLDETGKHLYAYADDVDTAYKIYTREVEHNVHRAPAFEESHDDPEA